MNLELDSKLHNISVREIAADQRKWIYTMEMSNRDGELDGWIF